MTTTAKIQAFDPTTHNIDDWLDRFHIIVEIEEINPKKIKTL